MSSGSSAIVWAWLLSILCRRHEGILSSSTRWCELLDPWRVVKTRTVFNCHELLHYMMQLLITYVEWFAFILLYTAYYYCHDLRKDWYFNRPGLEAKKRHKPGPGLEAKKIHKPSLETRPYFNRPGLEAKLSLVLNRVVSKITLGCPFFNFVLLKNNRAWE